MSLKLGSHPNLQSRGLEEDQILYSYKSMLNEYGDAALWGKSEIWPDKSRFYKVQQQGKSMGDY